MRDGIANRHRRGHRPFGIVFVRLRRTENRNHCVAGEVLHAATTTLHFGRQIS
jgi:hypothetical protein